eukprot:1130297-Rhodomonas_salina.9
MGHAVSCYALSGTEVGYAATRRFYSAEDEVPAGTGHCVLGPSYAIAGTNRRYAATRYNDNAYPYANTTSDPEGTGSISPYEPDTRCPVLT